MAEMTPERIALFAVNLASARQQIAEQGHTDVFDRVPFEDVEALYEAWSRAQQEIADLKQQIEDMRDPFVVYDDLAPRTPGEKAGGTDDGR